MRRCSLAIEHRLLPFASVQTALHFIRHYNVTGSDKLIKEDHHGSEIK
jgi:hypothetical protein